MFICAPLASLVRRLLLSVLLSFAGVTGAWGALENPAANSVVSGIGVISGVECDAQTVTAQIDDSAPFEAASGTSRNDTMGTCGDTDNGFGLLFNWNLVGDGAHEIVVRADGVEFARVTFVVTTLGLGEFPRGLEKEVTLADLLPSGADVVLEWVEAAQNFQIAKVIPEDVDRANCGAQEGEIEDRNGNVAAIPAHDGHRPRRIGNDRTHGVG